MEVFIFIREISKADYLLDVIEREVAEAIVLADLEHKGGGGAAAFVLLRDALARRRECRALPNVQALPDRPPYQEEYHTLTPEETGSTATDASESKTVAPPVKMIIQDASRRFDKALESGEIS